MNRRFYFPLSLVLTMLCLSPVFSSAQSTDSSAPSLGEVVKKNKQAAGPKAKAVITDETLRSKRGPIPPMALEGTENVDEVVNAIREFKKTHTPAETEEAVRQWYDEYDSLFADILDDNTRLVSRKEDRVLKEATGNYYGPDGDYNRAVQRRNSAIAEDREDFRRGRRNGFTIARLQQTFIKVRNDLQSLGLRYEWFKVRNANGNGSF